MSKPTHRFTITANHPAGPTTMPLCVVTYERSMADDIVTRLTAKGFTNITVKTEEITK